MERQKWSYKHSLPIVEQLTIILLIVGYVVTFISGGLGGAYLTRRFELKDRKVQKEKEKVPDTILLEQIEDKQGFTPIGDGNHHVPKAYKRFLLTNTSSINIKKCKLIFEFDKFSAIANYKIITPKGKYQCLFVEGTKIKYVFEIKDFNKTNVIEFQFEQEILNITGEEKGVENFWAAFLVDCKGVELERRTKEQTQLLTGTIIEK